MHDLLVACHNWLGIVRSYGVTRIGEDLTGKPDAYYGITQARFGGILVGRQGGRIGWYTRDQQWVPWVQVDTLEPPSPGCHQILRVGDAVYVANAPRDRVDVFSGDHRTIPIPGGGEDIRHPNSLNSFSGRIFVLCHNKRGPEPTSLAYVIEDGKAVLWRPIGARSAHNIWADLTGIYVLDSHHHRIATIYGKTVFEFPNGSWPRGVAATEDRRYVGLSPGAGRDHRADPVDAEIAVFDRAWKRIHTIRLPGAGQVHEIRLLGEPDLGHGILTLDLP